MIHGSFEEGVLAGFDVALLKHALTVLEGCQPPGLVNFLNAG
jgi:hypothetical protein